MARDSASKRIEALTERFSDFLDDNEYRVKGKSLTDQLIGDTDKLDKFFEAVEEYQNKRRKEQEKLNTLASLEAQLIKDEADLEAQRAATERKRAKERLKIENQLLKLNKERSTLAGKDLKANERETKFLTQQLKELTQIQKIQKDLDTNTEKFKNRWMPNQDEKEELAKAMKEASQAGFNVFKDGVKKLNVKEAWAGLIQGLTGGLDGKAGVVHAVDSLISGLADLSKKLDKTVEEIVKYKADWDTRLFGSDKSYSSVVDAIRDSVGMTPYVKQADVMKSLNEAIDKGIAFNVEQRAFLSTISDNIASTFDAFDSTLLQIVRVQQSDSTAARLGMEASLNAYLNSMFSTTEYLQGVSDSVTSALYEATSLLSSQESIGFEYQAQKWLGSLYSVGMSQGAITSIAESLGKLASGDISSVSSGTGKLLVMAASQAGLSYSDLMTQGINESNLNTLMEAMVSYLQQIANSNKVVQTQYAEVFGLKTSDIVAATNLSQDIQNITNFGLDYDEAVGNLNTMAKTIGERLSLGEKLTNITENFQYNIASGIAGDPALYALWKISGMLDSYMGGINIPAVFGMGTGVDLETTVADLMRVGAMSGSILGGIGEIINSLGSAVNGEGLTSALRKLGIDSQPSSITRGTGFTRLGTAVPTTSSSNYLGNTSGEDLYQSTMASAADQKKEFALKEQTEDEITTKILYRAITGQESPTDVNVIGALSSINDTIAVNFDTLLKNFDTDTPLIAINSNIERNLEDISSTTDILSKMLLAQYSTPRFADVSPASKTSDDLEVVTSLLQKQNAAIIRPVEDEDKLDQLSLINTNIAQIIDILTNNILKVQVIDNSISGFSR